MIMYSTDKPPSSKKYVKNYYITKTIMSLEYEISLFGKLSFRKKISKKKENLMINYNIKQIENYCKYVNLL